MRFLLLLLLCSSAFAISEENYSKLWERDVAPYYARLTLGEFKNAQGLMIRYRFDKQPQAMRTLVIFPGRTEPMIKYAELMYDLQSESLNVFILDHQGQGESDRLVLGDAGQVRRFSDYVRDARQFVQEIVLPQTEGTERVLLAHSMGGAIAAHVLKEVPGVFSRAVLSAPMLQINTAPYSESVAALITGALHLAGQGKKYAPGYGPYRSEQDTFETNTSTQSFVRFASAKSFWEEDPALVVGGPTTTWVKTSIAGSKKTLKLAPKISTKLLILQAGKDKVVVNSRQNKFCERAPSCQISLYANAYHGILSETDEIRTKALARLKAFLGI